MQNLHDDLPQFILCKYPPHTDTVCDDQPSSSTTGHDFAKSSRAEHTLVCLLLTLTIYYVIISTDFIKISI